MFKKFKDNFKKILNLSSDPQSISLAFSVGVFITITPFYGIHVWIVMITCLIFKLNYLACLTGSLLNIPPIAPIVYSISYIIGRSLTRTGIGNAEIRTAIDALVSGNFYQIRETFSMEIIISSFISLFIGCIIFGIIVSFISYIILLNFLNGRRKE